MDFTLDRNELKALYEITIDALETTKERIAKTDKFLLRERLHLEI